MNFPQATQEALGFYVYCLVDPRDNRVFYIGKGKGNRVFDHVRCAIEEDGSNLKLDTIRAILSDNLYIKHFIVRHKLTEIEAFKIESTLIDFLTYPAFNTEHVLTNIVSGHHEYDEGIKTVEDINAIYDCPKIQANHSDGILLVSLNRTFNQKKAGDIYKRPNLYESTRKYWSIGQGQPQNIKYVLGVYRGIVRCVISVSSYTWVDVSEEGIRFKKPRCCFEGKNLIDSPFLHKDVTDYPFSSGGAIRYI